MTAGVSVREYKTWLKTVGPLDWHARHEKSTEN